VEQNPEKRWAPRPDLPQWLRALCERVAARLIRVQGIEAIALGGSWVRGVARPDSDVDIALYYEPDAAFSPEELDTAASELDDRHAQRLVTSFGDWGEGVNGGGWLVIDGRQVDFLYRNLARVREVIGLCGDGKPGAIYQLGHPLGFQTQIYVGEIFFCRPLHDPGDELARLKRLCAQYPAAMRRALIEKHLFDARFEISIAAGPAGRGDTMYAAGCLFCAAGLMTLVLYALNRRYYVNEKGAFAESRGFAIKPTGFHDAVEAVLARLGGAPDELAASAAAMGSAFASLEELCGRELAASG
jgi:predicted nucleotidyltransferase